MDWVLTNVGGTIMIVTFVYVAVRMLLSSIGKFLCYLDYKKVHHG